MRSFHSYETNLDNGSDQIGGRAHASRPDNDEETSMKRAGRHRCERGPSRVYSALFWISLCFLLSAGLALHALKVQLPDTASIRNYHPPLVTSVYASDGTLIAEFYSERRYLIPLSEVPDHLIKAVLAAEDLRFYDHRGLDLPGIIRAAVKNFQAGEIIQGGSTITQQVVKSLLLTPERTFARKVKEAILAFWMESVLTKDEILYLYLNQVYFGAGAYGIEAAARSYFSKSARELNVAESALLAGLPKAPSRLSPFHDFGAARGRQRYVLEKMAQAGFISEDEAMATLSQPLHLARLSDCNVRNMDYFTEEVRRQVEARYGKDGLYKEGLQIYTTLDLNAQRLAEKALDRGLRELDKRHSDYRGVHFNIPEEEWPETRELLQKENGALGEGKIAAALVESFDPSSGRARVDLGEAKADIERAGWGWTRASMKQASRIFRVGDIIRVRLEELQDDSTWSAILEQDPGAEGAFMAIEPATGRVICMVGGRSFQRSQFNRCTQALRQPGSAFKPIIYAAALDKGFTEASIIDDVPLSLRGGTLRQRWTPRNYDKKFWGSITLRKALIHSRNVPTVRVLSSIGVDYAINYARRLGIDSPLTPTLSLALGASDVTLSSLITAYAPFANGGRRIQPYLIERVIDRNGKVLEEHGDTGELAISPQTAYIMTNLLSGVVEEGTGTRAKALNRPVAGKTGTTNDMKDAWFIGYTPSVLAGVWVGYDDHVTSLGKDETGGRAACPIWLYFMQEYLEGVPVQTFPIPSGVVMARMDPYTGRIIGSDSGRGTYAAFNGATPSPPVRLSRKEEPTRSSSVASTMESFFKSDLY